MRISDETLIALQALFQDLAAYEGAHQKWMERKSQAVEANNRSELEVADLSVRSWGEQVRKARQAIDDAIAIEYTKYPPQHARHFVELMKFHRVAPFEESVVVMTKFPEGHRKEVDSKLDDIITCVENAVKQFGFLPRIARGKSRFYDFLWDNVEIHLLGSKCGIAIVEGRYSSGVNPNVAMEWGWMRAMGKPVLYLRDRKFEDKRADFSGLLVSEFDWDDPSKSIEAAVQDFLKSQGPPLRRG